LVNLFELYDDARTCQRQTGNHLPSDSVASQKIQMPILYLICSMILQHIHLIYKNDMLKKHLPLGNAYFYVQIQNMLLDYNVSS